MALNDSPIGDPLGYLTMVSHFSSLQLADLYGWNMLRPLLDGYRYLPFTGASLRPYCLAHILNDIVVNDRRSIIEFGSGMSTIVIGRLMVRNQLDARLLSVEHNQAWAEQLVAQLKKEGTSEHIEVVVAPLSDCELAIENNAWYDLAIVRDKTDSRSFDAVIVDGPPAWESSKAKARYPAIPLLRDRLASRFSVYLDDANRAGEQSIIQEWQRVLSLEFRVTGRTLAYACGGERFATEPFSYM